MSNNTEHPLLRPTVILNGFDIYESKTQLHIIGSNESEGYYRVLRISRTTSDLKRMVEDDGVSHSRESIRQLATSIQSSGMKLVVAGVCAILGFVRFTKGYYISLVAGRRPVALLGGHHVYHVEDTRLLSITYRPERSDVEERCIARFRNVDLTKNFYYSHTYDITHTLQRNVCMWRNCTQRGSSQIGEWRYHSMFVWNYQLICNATQGVEIGTEWTIALIHGYVDQSKLSIFGRDVFITLIARRSRIFAGVRYLKRGVNGAGYVANDVETEQIINTMEVTSFDMPYGRPFSNPGYSAYVQHRGSIPLFWSQETSGIAPKPPIEINVRDPYFVEAGRHFDSLFHRYGTPIIVLSLIKTKERAKRESALGEEFSEGIHYLNQFLPRGKKIRYLAWDMSRAKKNRQEDVLAILEVIAEETLTLTGYFHNGNELYSNYLKRRSAGDTRSHRKGIRLQTGIVRSNCIDCLDRTNAAQSIVGKVALAHQLFELGQIDEPYLSFNTDAAMIIEEMYHDLGNTIALQYGGSHLVNTVQTYRRSTNWRSHSRDIVESLRRYYSNSLLDMERQEAITFFVEKSIFPECNLTAQSVENDKQSALDSIGIGRVVSRPNQIGKPMSTQWWTTLSDYGSVVDSSSIGDSNNAGSPRVESDIDDTSKTPTNRETSADNNGRNNVSMTRESETAAEKAADGYWNEYYRPHQYTSFDELFVGSLNSSASLHPSADIQNIPSPFADRGGKGRRATSSRTRYMQREPKWLKSESDECANPTLASRQEIYERLSIKTIVPQTSLPMSIGGWMTDGITAPLQEPRVCQSELEEYEKYVHQFDDLKKWIVPPSTLLYSDYLKNRDISRSFADNTETAQYFAPPPHNLRIDTSAESLYGPEDGQRSRRSQTPIPGEATFPRRAPHSALTASGHRLRRLLGPQSLLSPTGGRQQPRQRSSTSSDRGSLWGLWSQSSNADQQQQQQQDEHGLEKIATVSHLPLSNGSSQFPRSPLGLLSARSGLSNHDRSRSLDFSSIGSANTPSPLGRPAPPIHTVASPTAAAAATEGAILEPRVTEADLNIYQNYIKMRKAMSSHYS